MRILIQFGLILFATNLFSQIPMYIEEKSFTAGEEITLDIWSGQLDGLLSFQLRLDFENADILDITAGSPFDDIPHNIFNDNKTINSLWIPADVLSIDVPSNETWFTLTVLPSVDGSTFDIFTTGNDPWSEIVIEDSLDISGVTADFSFEVEERNFLVASEEVEERKILIQNNPVSDRLIVSGFSEESEITQATIFSAEGRQVKAMAFDYSNNKLDMNVSHLQTGVYFLYIPGRKNRTIKFIKI